MAIPTLSQKFFWAIQEINKAVLQLPNVNKFQALRESSDFGIAGNISYKLDS